MIRRTVIIIAATFLIAAPVFAQPFVIRNVRIFDGAKIIEANSVAVADGKILAVGNDVASPPNAQVIDGRGDTLMPSLIDSHVHIWTRDVLRQALMFGVTTELDMFMRWEQAQAWKQESRTSSELADFRTAGTCITAPRGHGSDYGVPGTEIRSPDEAQAMVDDRVAHGSDYIKIMYDYAPAFPVMSRETLAAVIRAAHVRHKLAIVHISSYLGARDAIAAGADGLAHLPDDRPPDAHFGRMLAEHHAFVITTMAIDDLIFGQREFAAAIRDSALAAMLDPAIRNAVEKQGHIDDAMRARLFAIESAQKDPPPFQRRRIEDLRAIAPDSYHAYTNVEAALRLAHDAGAPVLAGTDASNTFPPGASLLTELALMVKAGLTPTAALADATSVPAKIFALDDRGRIAPGMRADLLLARGDPTKDIRATRDIVAIWKQGARVDRESYREEIAQEDIAWKFGAGWRPDRDGISNGTSSVRLRIADGGPQHEASTLILDCDVKPAIKYPFAGAMYSPALARRKISADENSVTFWTRGDGQTYSVAMFTEHGESMPALRPFVAGTLWEAHRMPFSDFHTDGHDLTLLSFVATTPGPHHFEISGFRFTP